MMDNIQIFIAIVLTVLFAGLSGVGGCRAGYEKGMKVGVKELIPDCTEHRHGTTWPSHGSHKSQWVCISGEWLEVKNIPE